MNPTPAMLEAAAEAAAAFLEREGARRDLPFLRAFPQNSCEAASAIFALAIAAKYRAANVHVAHGYDREHNSSHFWVEVADYFADLTAHQFRTHSGPITGRCPNPFEVQFPDVERASPEAALQRFSPASRAAYALAASDLEKALAA
ncbi:hypothetical protein RAMLITH_05970 [Ramlibacter sp. RBP-2]|uniref:Uncharacterized protein n=2 Tax=Ramlibacter lithotrophicus TaxID=2606681 RepID=A0A7X6I5I7_9BURK|nr:hypothetical protein [Ramlibacter lithotrophicus]